jgi:hypothetical protein
LFLADGRTDRQTKRQTGVHDKVNSRFFPISQTRLKTVKMTANAKDKNKWIIPPFFHAPSCHFYRDVFPYTLFRIRPKWKKAVMTDFK